MTIKIETDENGNGWLDIIDVETGEILDSAQVNPSHSPSCTVEALMAWARRRIKELS